MRTTKTVGTGITAKTVTIVSDADDMAEVLKTAFDDWNKAHEEGGGDYGAVTLDIVRRMQSIAASAPQKPDRDSAGDFAKRFLRLHKIAIAEIQRGNPDTAARFAYEAGYLHCQAHMKFKWETDTLRGIKVKQSGAKNGRSQPQRDSGMAHEFCSKRTESGLSDTALKVKIGMRYGLSRRAAIDAVNRGLKKIVQEPANRTG
jgi:hypothetical protein